MSDITFVVGMDQRQFQQGLQQVKAQAQAASGQVGQSFQVAGAKMQGWADPINSLNRGFAAVSGAGMRMLGTVGLIGAGIAFANVQLEKSLGLTKEQRETLDKMAAATADIALKRDAMRAGVEIDLGLNRQVKDIIEEQKRLQEQLNERYSRTESFVNFMKRQWREITGEQKNLDFFAREQVDHLERQKNALEEIAKIEANRVKFQREWSAYVTMEDARLENSRRLEQARSEAEQRSRDEESKRFREEWDAFQTMEDARMHNERVLSQARAEATARLAPVSSRSVAAGSLTRSVDRQILGQAAAKQAQDVHTIRTTLVQLLSTQKEILIASRGGARA